LADAAHARFADAEAELEAAFLLGTSAVGDRMAALLMAHAELAEAMHDPTRATDLVRRIAAYNVAGTGAWYRPASLVVEIDRPARIAIHAFPAAPGAPTLAGGFAAAPIAATTGPRLAATLPAGSYLAVIEPRDGLAFRDPVLLGRGEQLVRTHRALPRAAAPPGLVYVPAGAFLYGSALGDVFRRSFLTAPALHAARTEAFWIARTEVTFAQWIEYLRALPPEERAAHAPRIDGTRGVRLTERGGRFVLAIEPTIARLEAEEGQPIVYAERTVRARVAWERMPIVGVSYREAAEYLAWLDRTGRVPGARLCTAREWERAARGADGRSFPAGEALADTDANIDATYGRRPLAYGPDEVGSFPASDSPFGVADLAGNVWELVRGAGDGLELKGGAWYFGRAAALSSNRNATEPTQRDLRVGLRVCADAARAR
jgi:formylglycine-generating enzyme required for sulfatase activity